MDKDEKWAGRLGGETVAGRSEAGRVARRWRTGASRGDCRAGTRLDR